MRCLLLGSAGANVENVAKMFPQDLLSAYSTHYPQRQQSNSVPELKDTYSFATYLQRNSRATQQIVNTQMRLVLWQSYYRKGEHSVKHCTWCFLLQNPPGLHSNHAVYGNTGIVICDTASDNGHCLIYHKMHVRALNGANCSPFKG